MDKQETKKLFIEQLKKTPIIQVCCEKLSVSRSSVYRWKKDNINFGKAVDKALAEGKSFVNDMAEGQLLNAIRKENLTAIIFWLKSNHPSYSNKLVVSGSLETRSAELTPEQEASIKRALLLANLSTKGDKNVITKTTK